MKNIKRLGMVINVIVFMFACTMINYTENVDSNIPKPYSVILGSDGVVTWDIDDENTADPSIHYIYKKFQIKLQKRYLDTVRNDYDWKDFGSIKAVSVVENTPDEYIASVEISSPGYYRAMVRAYTTESVYGPWSDASSDAAFDSATTNININDGSSVASNYGPGTIYYGTSGMQVNNPYQNYGGTANVIDTNGQYITSSGQGAAYIYDNSYQDNVAYQGQSTANVGVGPGVNNGATQDTFAPGPGTNAQVYTGKANNNIPNPGYTDMGIVNTTQIIQSGPSQAGSLQAGALQPGSFQTGSFQVGSFQSGPSQSGSAFYGGQNWSTEVGWHVDVNGFYYYQYNGEYLRNQWYLIENSYYRFNEQGYALINKWFKDPTNAAWYYLGADGKMVTGWQKISGVWYYLNPERGANYGVMYCNCSINIGGKFYAFDSEGGCILNGYYDGYYYGADGSRQ